jgi:hypothetical protein
MLTGAELEIVFALAAPLPSDRRGAAVEDGLRACPEAAHGPGLAHRVACELQRNFFTPPARIPRPQFFNRRRFPHR